jgi:hypothetical protein
MATPSTLEEVRAIRRASYPVATVEYLRLHRILLTLTDAGGCECAPGIKDTSEHAPTPSKPALLTRRNRGAFSLAIVASIEMVALLPDVLVVSLN